jgi:hypothetical protein
MEGLDLPQLVGIIVPVVIGIAKMILGMKNPTELSKEEVAAIALFEALIAFLEIQR